MQTQVFTSGANPQWCGQPGLIFENGKWYDQNGQPADCEVYSFENNQKDAA